MARPRVRVFRVFVDNPRTWRGKNIRLWLLEERAERQGHDVGTAMENVVATPVSDEARVILRVPMQSGGMDVAPPTHTDAGACSGNVCGNTSTHQRTAMTELHVPFDRKQGSQVQSWRDTLKPREATSNPRSTRKKKKTQDTIETHTRITFIPDLDGREKRQAIHDRRAETGAT